MVKSDEDHPIASEIEENPYTGCPTQMGTTSNSIFYFFKSHILPLKLFSQGFSFIALAIW